MSDNKMGGVSDKVRSALYRFFSKQKLEDDADWAKVIDELTRLGPKKSLKKLGL
ncbi:MAG: hypothetical protein V4682_03075 [Patescibacteria group bacterium]